MFDTGTIITLEIQKCGTNAKPRARRRRRRNKHLRVQLINVSPGNIIYFETQKRLSCTKHNKERQTKKDKRER